MHMGNQLLMLLFSFPDLTEWFYLECNEYLSLQVQVGVTVTPDIHSFDLTDREHFIILGCDGLWGVFFRLVKAFIDFVFDTGSSWILLLLFYQVFGPSDAVGFVQKLLKVSAEYSFLYHTRNILRWYETN